MAFNIVEVGYKTLVLTIPTLLILRRKPEDGFLTTLAYIPTGIGIPQ
jgi:hypothetical protein